MNRIIFEESRVSTTRDRLEKHRKAPTLVGIWDNKLMLEIRQELVKEGWGEDEAMEMTKELANVKVKVARAIYEEVGRRREALNAPVMREEVDRWARERRGRKYRMWRRTIEETWKTRKVEEAEIWEVKEGEKMRWEMQFKEQEWPGMMKRKENKDKWNRLEKEERGAIEEIKWERRGLKKVRGEMILRMVNDGENEEIESMYIEMLARTEEWMRNPAKMIEHIAKKRSGRT